MKNVFGNLKTAALAILFICSLCLLLLPYIDFFRNFYTNYLFENFISELFYKILVCIPPFSIVFVPLFVFKLKDKTIRQKWDLYFGASVFLFAVFYTVVLWKSGSGNIVIANIKNMEKAVEIIDILQNEDASVGKIQDNYAVFVHNSNENYRDSLLVKLAEENPINYYLNNDENNNLSAPDKIPIKVYLKYFAKNTENEIRQIDGVYRVNVSITLPDNDKYKIDINVKVLDDFNEEKIRKTLDNLLPVYSNVETTVSLSKSGYMASSGWLKEQKDKVYSLNKEKRYKKALDLMHKINEKRPKTFDTKCTEKMVEVNERISKNQKDYNAYIERGKLLAPPLFFKSSIQDDCYGEFWNSDFDTQNTINDYLKALSINPESYEVYTLLHSAEMSGLEKPYNYLEHMLMAEKYNPNYEIYWDLSSYYEEKMDFYKSAKYKVAAKKYELELKKFDLPKPHKSLFSKIIDECFPQNCKDERNRIKNYKAAIKTAEDEIKNNPNDKMQYEIKQEIEQDFKDYQDNMPAFCKLITGDVR